MQGGPRCPGAQVPAPAGRGQDAVAEGLSGQGHYGVALSVEMAGWSPGASRATGDQAPRSLVQGEEEEPVPRWGTPTPL